LCELGVFELVILYIAHSQCQLQVCLIYYTLFYYAWISNMIMIMKTMMTVATSSIKTAIVINTIVNNHINILKVAET